MTNNNPNRIASLDGLRAISIALVVFSHLSGTNGFIVPEWIGRYFELGGLGVRVFFAISGFLITRLLLDEIRETGGMRLDRFYLRRTLRIFPPYYAFLLVLIALAAMDLIQLDPRDRIHALTYTSNYYSGRSWNIGHTWSLSVEEQFYLLWPALLILAGMRRGLWAAAALIVICPLLRVYLWHLSPSVETGIGERFETIADSIAVGCVLAGARDWLHTRRPYQLLMRSKLFIAAPLAVLLASSLYDRPRINFLFAFTIMNIGIAASIDWCVTNSEGRVGRFLNAKPIVFVGVMSYSIYLWQQLFLNRNSTALLTSFPLNIIMVIVAALASYYLIERPSLRARRRLENRIVESAVQKGLQVDCAMETQAAGGAEQSVFVEPPIPAK